LDPTPRFYKQHRTDLFLEKLQLIGDGRLANPEFLGSFGNTEVPCGQDKQLQSVHIHGCPLQYM
jgi:hypothetical protein